MNEPVPDSMQRLLSPRSIAVIGASGTEMSIGHTVFANLRRSFSGRLYPVNPRADTVQGVDSVASIGDLPEPVDLVVVAVPAALTPQVIRDAADRGVGGAVVLSANFAEAGAVGAALQAQVAEIGRRSGLRIIGPNCIGYMNLAGGVMANFVLQPDDEWPAFGSVALVSQSGGFGGFMTRKAVTSGVQLGWFASTGNEVDVNVAEVLAYVVERPEIKVLMVFCEALRDPDDFVAAADRAAELDKPLVVLKTGRTAVAAQAALSHTASVAGSAVAFDAVCRQHGVIVATGMEQMLDMALIFQDGRRARSTGVGIMTVSGGAGVLVADAAAMAGLTVPRLPAADQRTIEAVMPVPFYGSTSNPVDTTAQLYRDPDAFPAALRVLASSDVVDMIVPIIIGGSETHEQPLVDLYHLTDKPLAVAASGWSDFLAQAGVPLYTDPARAIAALAAMAHYSQRPPFTPVAPWVPNVDRGGRVRALLGQAQGHPMLLESTSKEVLSLYGVPVVAEREVTTVDEAVAAAARFDGPVALKVMSYELPHKSEAGALRLGLEGASSVRQGYLDMIAEVQREAPLADIHSVLVQEMLPARLELTCGMQRDPVFGPMVAIGLGGVLVELMDEVVLLRLPFGPGDVRRALATLLGGRLLSGRRGLVDAEVDSITRVLIGVGHLALEVDAITEIDVNPLRVHRGRVVAADALIVVGVSMEAAVV
jgi:acyl-CoA synthetase (NDP forming)